MYILVYAILTEWIDFLMYHYSPSDYLPGSGNLCLNADLHYCPNVFADAAQIGRFHTHLTSFIFQCSAASVEAVLQGHTAFGHRYGATTPVQLVKCVTIFALCKHKLIRHFIKKHYIILPTWEPFDCIQPGGD